MGRWQKTIELIINLQPRAFWCHMHWWTPLCLDLVFIMDKQWLAEGKWSVRRWLPPKPHQPLMILPAHSRPMGRRPYVTLVCCNWSGQITRLPSTCLLAPTLGLVSWWGPSNTGLGDGVVLDGLVFTGGFWNCQGMTHLTFALGDPIRTIKPLTT